MSVQGIQQVKPHYNHYGVTCSPSWVSMNDVKNVVLIKDEEEIRCSVNELLDVLGSNEDIRGQLFDLVQTQQIVEKL